MANSIVEPTHKKKYLINRNFAFLFFGQGISLLGDKIFDFTLIVWIASVLAKGQTWAPIAVSGLLIATSIPSFLFGPIAGVYVDRWNHRFTMLRMDGLRALFVLSLLLITNVTPLPFRKNGSMPISFQLVGIYFIVFCVSLCSQFFDPSRFALIGDIVNEKQQSQASGLLRASQAVATIIGPPLAAPLLFSVGAEWALLVNALSFIVSFLAISQIKVTQISKPVSNSKAQQEFVKGLTFVMKTQSIRVILIAAFIAALGTGSFEALYIFFLTKNLHASAQYIGFLGTALGTGAILGALFAGTLGNKIGAKRLLIIALLAFGLLFIGLSRVTNIEIALIIIVLMGIAQAIFSVAVSPIVLKETPKEMLGRVVSVLTPTEMTTMLLSISVSGFLASTVLANFHATFLHLTFGPIDTIFSVAGFLLLISGLYAGISFKWKKI